MPDSERYAQWIVDNQDKKDTPEFQTVATAYRTARDQATVAQPQQAASQVAEPVYESLQEQRSDISGRATLPIGPFDTGIKIPQWLDEGLAGVGLRVNKAITLGRHKVDEGTDELLDDSTAATVGKIVGDVGIAATGGKLLKGAGALAQAGNAARTGRALQVAGQSITAPTSVRQAAAGGAAYGALTNDNRLESGAGGAAGGALGASVPKVFSSIVKPKLQEGADALLRRGIKLTPGELIGGIVQRVEDGATSVPVLGDFIKTSKRSSIQQFNRSVIDDALSNIGHSLDDGIPMGREAIASANEVISNGYDDVLSKASVRLDEVFVDDLINLNDMIEALPAKEQRMFHNTVNKEILERAFGNDQMLALGETFKETDSFLRGTYDRLLKSTDHYQYKLGQAIREVHKSLMGMAKRQNPEWADHVASLDRAYAVMSRVNDASSRAGANSGVFSPAQLLAAIRKSSGARQFASGRGMGQELAESAKDVLAQTVPDSGTPFRAMNMLTLGGAGMISPQAAVAGGGASAIYTKPGIGAVNTLLAKRPAGAVAVSEALEKLSAPGAAVSVPVGLQVSDQ